MWYRHRIVCYKTAKHHMSEALWLRCRARGRVGRWSPSWKPRLTRDMWRLPSHRRFIADYNFFFNCPLERRFYLLWASLAFQSQRHKGSEQTASRDLIKSL